MPRSADELLVTVGLGHVAATAYRRLSGGERQRLALALALVGRPEVLVLDEPTAGMDPEARAMARGIVADERARGAAILLTSHDLGDVERLADRVVVIDRGRVVAAGSPAELIARVRPSVRIRLDRPLDAAELAGLERHLATLIPGARLVPEPDVARYRVEGVDADPAGLPPLVAGLAAACADVGRLIVELRTGGGSLEDAYLALVEAGRVEGPS